jgi:LysR family nitrogen assimilation transcriptional regulator
MNLKQLEYFVSVAELGSFSKAATVLDVAQPALSRHVRLLETDLRVTLLVRTGRGVLLTEAGKRLFDYSMGILQLMSRAREEIDATRDEPSGRIVVGLPPSFGRMLTLSLVEGFKQTLPNAQLSIVEGLSAHLGEWISTGRADLALLLNPEPHSGLEIMPVLNEDICLVGPLDSLPHLASEIPLSSLDSFPLILPERSHAIRKLLETQAALKGVKLQVAWEISSIQSILDLVCAGYGYAVLPRSAVGLGGVPREFALHTVTEPRLTSALCLATSINKQNTPLIEHAKRMLKDLILCCPTGSHNKP